MPDQTPYEHIPFDVEEDMGGGETTVDHVHGVRSFLERWPPRWKLGAGADLPDGPGMDDR